MDIHDVRRLKGEAEARIYEVLNELCHTTKLSLEEIKLGFVQTGLDNKRLTSVKVVFEL